MNITITEIRNIVEDFFNLSSGDSLLKARKREILSARQIIHYFCIKEADDRRLLLKLTRYHSHKSVDIWSSGLIGKKIGGKDHATVLHSAKAVSNLIDTEHLFRSDIESIQKLISEKSEDNIKSEKYAKLNKTDYKYDISKEEIIRTIERAVLSLLIKTKCYSKNASAKNELSTHIDNLLTMNFIDSKASLIKIRDLL